MRKLTKAILFGIFATLLTAASLLFPGFYSSHDNMHPLRLKEYTSCRIDGQFPCRYSNESGYNCGYPLFNFYAPFAYEVGLQLKGFSLNSLDYVSTVKAVYVLATFFGFMGMYFLTSRYSSSLGALLSAFLYTLAPYKALDLYVRGAYTEYMALAILPWLILSIVTYNKKPTNRAFFIILAVISILSHNLFPVLFGLIALYFAFSKLKKILLDSFLAIGISSFFLLPAILERSLTTNQTMTSGYFRYIIHFATISQLFFDRFWGFGASLWGPKDDMSFQIGIIHWSLAVLGSLYLFKIKKYRLLPFLLLFFLFLTHNKSTFIWQFLPFLQYVQFPWRFLGPAVFLASFIIGLTFNKNKLVFVVIVAGSILLYGGYFKAEKWDPELTDAKKFSGELLLDQQRSGLPDYWPIYGKKLPETACSSTPTYDSNNLTIKNYKRASDYAYLEVVVSGSPQKITLPIAYFPNWQVLLDSQKLEKTDYNPDSGLVEVILPIGEHKLELVKENSSIESVANTISLIFLAITALLLSSKIWLKK